MNTHVVAPRPSSGATECWSTLSITKPSIVTHHPRNIKTIPSTTSPQPSTFTKHSLHQQEPSSTNHQPAIIPHQHPTTSLQPLDTRIPDASGRQDSSVAYRPCQVSASPSWTVPSRSEIAAWLVVARGTVHRWDFSWLSRFRYESFTSGFSWRYVD